ncbi:TIGR03768 family metallophosphoesterase [Pusillimonas sp. NJUB218]|uniref:TIGR03768 family metallophosphoesterase n=1 Tax=Pusillimonas sp. NJUB218 TaxID=2023230 RepID=UPI0018F2A5B7|nr:TIGR03768 family metallophosphoesterase [Pusillimonas sp. NJUB218]
MKSSYYQMNPTGSTINEGSGEAGFSRRQFIKYSFGFAAGFCFGAVPKAFAASGGNTSLQRYPIDAGKVKKTTDQMLAFDVKAAPVSSLKSSVGLHPTELSQVQDYDMFGYGQYQMGNGLPVVSRYDLLSRAAGYTAPKKRAKLASFFAITDVHITDKEAPNQLIYIQQADSVHGSRMTSIYSPVISYTTQMLDATIQTVNALHDQSPFDFGISLGDVCDSARYNEVRMYIDVIDGKSITPSSGAHLGADTVDYQKPFQAAGLNPSIPWYQVLGNHDHFFIGSVPVDADPSLGIRESYVSDQVWAVGDVLIPNAAKSKPMALPPVIYDIQASIAGTSPVTLNDPVTGIAGNTFYMGVVDGSSPYGAIKYAGKKEDFASPPKVAADPNRRALLRSEWIDEFFNTTTQPKGHGFGLVPEALRSSQDGFACYSFVPRPEIPLKVIVLDNTQLETDGSRDIHGHGFLDEVRWRWLQDELDAGQVNNQLMVIAAHIPIAVAASGSLMEWWNPKGQNTPQQNDPNAVIDNAVTLPELIKKLQDTPNLVMWMAGHRHLNTVKALPAYGDAGQLVPEKSFWQVETSSLQHFPQQFRTFDIYFNSDGTVSISAINVDPEVADGTPAATSRKYAIAEHQICQTPLRSNAPNLQYFPGTTLKVDSVDPTRAQDGSLDPSIQYGDVEGVPYCASYNAELFKQLTPKMIEVMNRLV